MYPKLKIDFVAINAAFGPVTIEWLANKFKIPKNLMFIKSPDRGFKHKLQELGGVRVITGG